ncbi:MAG TPA: response regulator [Rhodanobacteraceae bacterium]|nr:response regulator [Rhodanobacteraceae bacterium]
MEDGDSLEGCRVLIVEDDAMISMMLQDLLEDMGCQVVGVASRLEEARHKSEAEDFDVALLDVNLRGERTFPVAEAMQQHHRPFVLTTGYATTILPDSLRDATLLQKPYRRQDLECALWDAMHGG